MDEKRSALKNLNPDKGTSKGVIIFVIVAIIIITAFWFVTRGEDEASLGQDSTQTTSIVQEPEVESK